MVISFAILFFSLRGGVSVGEAIDTQPKKHTEAGPFMQITCLDKEAGPVVFRLGVTRPEQVRRNFHIIHVLGHLSKVFSPASGSSSPWDFREQLAPSTEPPKYQAPPPLPKVAVDLNLHDGGGEGDDLEVQIEEFAEKEKETRQVARYDDGKMKSETFYRDGEGHGRHTVWHPNGQKKLEGQFQKNYAQGTFTFWNEKGAITETRDYVVGVLKKTVPFRDGKPLIHDQEVLDFKYHRAEMRKGYLPVPTGEKGGWRSVEASNVPDLLQPGEASARIDLGALLPWKEERYHIYVRAFLRPSHQAARVPIRIEILPKKADSEPAAAVDTFSGFQGLLLSGIESGMPRLETMRQVIERWKRETKKLLKSRKGRDLFVAPRGKPGSQGTRADPLDLQTVLQPPRGREIARPGDTVWLTGGVYEAPAWMTTQAKERIDLARNTATARELPKVDNLGLDVEPTEEEIQKELAEPKDEEKPLQNKSDARILNPPDELRPYLDYEFISALEGTAGQPIIVRQVPGERAVLNGGLMVRGKHTWFWGFEITEPDGRANSGRAKPSVTSMAPGVRFINLHVHRGAQGFAFWSSSPDSEIYGCIIHDFGWSQGGGRGHGHGFYTQNDHGMKRIIDNIVFHGYGWNFHAYTQGGEVFNYYIEGNVSFSAGMKKKGQVTDNWLIQTWRPAHRMFFFNNISYHPLSFVRGVRFHSWGYDTELVLRGNRFFGSSQAMAIGRWQSVECLENIFWGRHALVNAKPRDPSEHRDAYLWDRNTYFLPAKGKPFNFSGAACDFEDWKRLSGYDSKGKANAGKGGRPTGTEIIVRPNFYDPGRAHVSVLNWDGNSEAQVELSSFLKKGQQFAVYHVLDLEAHGLAKPVFESSFDGMPVSLPLKRHPIAPDLDVFLVMPGNPPVGQK